MRRASAQLARIQATARAMASSVNVDTRARPLLRASLAWRLLGGRPVCATAVTCRALVYSMGVPLALMRTLNVVNAYIRIAVAGDAFGARD